MTAFNIFCIIASLPPCLSIISCSMYTDTCFFFFAGSTGFRPAFDRLFIFNKFKVEDIVTEIAVESFKHFVYFIKGKAVVVAIQPLFKIFANLL